MGLTPPPTSRTLVAVGIPGDAPKGQTVLRPATSDTSGRVRVMNSTSPFDPAVLSSVMSPPADARSLDIAFFDYEPPADLVQAAKDAFGPDIAPWYFAQCFRCNEADDVDNAEPFRDDTERDSWAVAHVAATGHIVKVWAATDHRLGGGGELITNPHTAAMLSFDESRQGWRYVCTDKACERSQGPYDSGQLALASLRGHTAKAAR